MQVKEETELELLFLQNERVGRRDARNPDNLPVERLTLSVSDAGVLRKIKALDPYWAEHREMMVYESPPSGSTLLLGAVDAWKAKMREASPPYMPPHESRDIQKLYGEIRRMILVIFSRLITNKESKSQWISKEYMADLIYDNFIFTIPILWDTCLVYGVDNMRHVARILESVFALQPRYEGDAAAAVAFVNEAFKYIILQVNKDYDAIEPPNLPKTFEGFSEIKRPVDSKHQSPLTFTILKDLVIHMLDMAMTLRVFVETIVQLYEYGIPNLYEKLKEVGDETSVTYTEVEGYIDTARSELIDIFREILAAYKNAILNGDDTVKTDFILQAIYSNLDEPIPETTQQTQPIANGHIENIDNQPGPSTDHEIPLDIRQESLISEVRDIMPHLGDGFILKCLEHYGFNSERVINSILEGTLDPSLRKTGVQRLNVFDGDQFDIMTRDDVDLSKIHKGKRKDKYKNIKELLDDKSDVRQMGDIYSKYNLVCDDAAMYSDEYDDTYDSDGAAPAPADPTDERRPFVTPRALRTNARDKEGQEKEVLASRDRKEKHKSSRGNHSRRQGGAVET
ncbi:hypothetical protein MSG28_012999 [Choristoneura fumiferana]|uniref:Uncharacterized protein n=1 Tax=Choristoneura fumiferana TaxID=7141 RepID=A0ACC0KS84_CHOFU|nr:hypothetical protein MSG28_012999 [Choristoneura fumiferana]